jgi:HD-like signal output (HDOD) protein
LFQLLEEIKTAVNFPSPPAIAMKVIELASDPDLDAAQLALLIGKDPALAAKVLRVANSPLYSKRPKSEDLRQALVVLGLNGAIKLVLSFSLRRAWGGAADALEASGRRYDALTGVFNR